MSGQPRPFEEFRLDTEAGDLGKRRRRYGKTLFIAHHASLRFSAGPQRTLLGSVGAPAALAMHDPQDARILAPRRHKVDEHGYAIVRLELGLNDQRPRPIPPHSRWASKQSGLCRSRSEATDCTDRGQAVR
jgi:hypothetical protein